MQKERKTPDLQQASLKKHPFTVPESYFESLPGRVMERISEQEDQKVPVRKMLTGSRFRIAVAAAVIGVALISFSIIRFTLNGGDFSNYPDVALLEQMNIIDDDYYLVDFLEEESYVPDEEEAYVNQAIEYLASVDVEMDLIFE